jgi:hypothetical protein
MQSLNVDNGYTKFIGWDNTVSADVNFQFLWSPERLKVYQTKITQLLEGVSPDGRPIIVPLKTIGNVLYQCYESHRPQVGDIYSRFTQSENTRDDVRDIVDRTINIIVSQIKNEYEVIDNNSKLSIWNTVYGDFNKHGLRQHPQIKVRKRRPSTMQFHMRY